MIQIKLVDQTGGCVVAGLINQSFGTPAQDRVRLLCFDTGMETAILVVLCAGLILSLAYAVGFIN